MTEVFRTPRKTAKGLGAAKAGVGHWMAQRVTAVALVVLVPVFLIQILFGFQPGYLNARAWIADPVNAVILIALVSAAFYHMRLGLQVVVEDYIHSSGTKIILLLLNTFAAISMWFVCVFSVLFVALSAA